MAETKKEGEYTAEEIVDHAKKNHIWLNAFSCVSPTDEFLRGLGQVVLDHLNASEMRDDLIGKTHVVYLRLNKS